MISPYETEYNDKIDLYIKSPRHLMRGNIITITKSKISTKDPILLSIYVVLSSLLFVSSSVGFCMKIGATSDLVKMSFKFSSILASASTSEYGGTYGPSNLSLS